MIDKLTGPTVKVRLNVLSFEDGGQHVLQSEEVIKSNIRQANISMSAACAEMDALEAKENVSDFARVRSDDRLWAARRGIAYAEQAKKEYDECVGKANPVEYTINTPTYDELMILEDAAKVEKNGIPSLDMAALGKLVRPLMFTVDVPGILPPHYGRCWQRWLREVYPQADDIPFI